jgi:hypothetical protein
MRSKVTVTVAASGELPDNRLHVERTFGDRGYAPTSEPHKTVTVEMRRQARRCPSLGVLLREIGRPLSMLASLMQPYVLHVQTFLLADAAGTQGVQTRPNPTAKDQLVSVTAVMVDVRLTAGATTAR